MTAADRARVEAAGWFEISDGYWALWPDKAKALIARVFRLGGGRCYWETRSESGTADDLLAAILAASKALRVEVAEKNGPPG